MKEMIKSEITGHEYAPIDCVRIINPLQSAFYVSSGATLYDIYTSKDFKTNKPIWVFIFNRCETKELYDRWCNHETD